MEHVAAAGLETDTLCSEAVGREVDITYVGYK